MKEQSTHAETPGRDEIMNDISKWANECKGVGKPRGKREILRIGVQFFPTESLEREMRIWKFGKTPKNFEGNFFINLNNSLKNNWAK